MTIRSSAASRLAIAGGGVLALVLTAGAASADSGAPSSDAAPDTAVSDTGEVPAFVPGATPNESEAFRGTGDLADAAGVDTDPAPLSGTFAPARSGFTPSSVIGTDDRVRVTDTTTYPERASALILFDTPSGGGAMCTGWFYDESAIATAGHCLYTHDGANSGWNTNFRVYAGRDATNQPYGECGHTTAYSVNGWTQDANPEFDYGALALDCSVGQTVGWFGLRWQDASFDGQSATVTGYPGEKSPSYSQWTHTNTIQESQTRRLYYDIDTTGGQSGSAVYQPGCEGFCGVAVHAYGAGGNGLNSGARITQAAYDNFESWRP